MNERNENREQLLQGLVLSQLSKACAPLSCIYNEHLLQEAPEEEIRMKIAARKQA